MNKEYILYPGIYKNGKEGLDQYGNPYDGTSPFSITDTVFDNNIPITKYLDEYEKRIKRVADRILPYYHKITIYPNMWIYNNDNSYRYRYKDDILFKYFRYPQIHIDLNTSLYLTFDMKSKWITINKTYIKNTIDIYIDKKLDKPIDIYLVCRPRKIPLNFDIHVDYTYWNIDKKTNGYYIYDYIYELVSDDYIAYCNFKYDDLFTYHKVGSMFIYAKCVYNHIYLYSQKPFTGNINIQLTEREVI